MKINIPWAEFKQKFFLILLPVFFVLHGYNENYNSVQVTETLLLIGKYLLATFVLFSLFLFLFKSGSKSAIFVFAFLCFYFFFGAAHDAVKKEFPNAFFVKYIFILPSSLFFFIALFLIIKKTKREFLHLRRFLNLLLLILVLIDLPSLIFKAVYANKPSPLGMGLVACDTCSKPDIYLIVADEYAGHRELEKVFHFNNSFFEKALESRGFHLIKDSKSNYNFTVFSLSSMLSMNYLKKIEGSNSSKHDMNICYDLINHNNLWNYFKESGYDIKNYSIFNVKDIPTKAPQNLLIIGTDLISSQTFLSRINRDIRFNLVTKFKIKSEIERMANYVNACNQKLSRSLSDETKAKSRRPKFVYTHLIMPHHPYFFDSSGKKTPIEKLTNEYDTDRKLYLEYLIYTNKILLELIDTIKKNSTQPPVIIVMGDHGFRQFNYKTEAQYYFMNLNAVYFPNARYSLFYDGMSNINQFRIILNSLFNQKLPLLKDSTSFLRQ